MKKKFPQTDLQNLPQCAIEFITLVIKKMRYRKKVRADVMAELAGHFEDELRDCKSDEEKEQKAKELIADFGDVKLLGVLLRRAKKRCRPLWQKALVHSLQVTGTIVIYIIIRVVFLSIGTPTINVNYIDWLNNLVRVNGPEQENAKLYYDKAAELWEPFLSEIQNKLSMCTSKGCCANNRWLADFNDFEMEHLVKWLTDNQTAFEALKQGSQKIYYWPMYTGENVELTRNVPADAARTLSNYCTLARAMRCQIAYDMYKGNIAAALDNCMVLQRFGNHLQGKGLLIEQMVGIAIESIAQERIFAILETADVPVDMLKSFDKELQNHLARQRTVVNWEAAKAFWYDLIQRGFTDDGKGSGRVLKKGLPLAVKDWKNALFGFVFLSYPDRRQVTETIDEYYEQAKELFLKTPWQLHNESRTVEKLTKIGDKCLLLKIQGPALRRTGGQVWAVQTQRAGLLTVLAILRYEKEKGAHPAGLEELVAGEYLKELPMDPYSDSPLVYKKTDNNFLLYSIGPNFKDDSGQISRDSEGRSRTCAHEGDAVFWPVPKPQTRQELETRRPKRRLRGKTHRKTKAEKK